MSGAARYAYLDHPGPIAFAHRGGASGRPENTLVAFERAVALGYRYVETDVHATRDGVLLAFHDDRLDRVTDGSGEIAALDYAEVARARVAGTEPIPRLEDLLGAWPDLRVNVDVKHDASVEPLVDTLRRTGAAERVCVGSFSGSRMALVRRLLGPSVCTAIGPGGVRALRLAAWGLRPARTWALAEGAACVQIPVRYGPIPLVDAALIHTAHGLGLPVHVWTIDDPAEMRRLLDLGVDGIMTDLPGVLRDVLVERGRWVASGGGVHSTPLPPSTMPA